MADGALTHGSRRRRGSLPQQQGKIDRRWLGIASLKAPMGHRRRRMVSYKYLQQGRKANKSQLDHSKRSRP